MQQYLEIKAQYQDAFLFFRLGDFYEMFFEDAIKASQELEITLTSRGGDEDRIPMCGVPHHSSRNYINQLIERGFKVAICEQTEDPKQAKGVVKREVVQLITPGTVMEGTMIDEKENNYISTVTAFDDDSFGVGYYDLTTGEGRVTLLNGDWQDVTGEIYSISSKEVVISSSVSEEIQKDLVDRLGVTISYEENTSIAESLQHITVNIEQTKLIQTISRLLNYLVQTQKRSLDHLQPVQFYEINQYMKMDFHSKRNLELVETIRTKGKKGSLLWLLDQTATAMGGRLLKQWLEKPLINQGEISKRHQLVNVLINQFFEREEVRDKLRNVYDLERLAGRVAFGNVNARDLIQLKKSLQQVPEIVEVLSRVEEPAIQNLLGQIDPCEDLLDLLEQSIEENPPHTIKEGSIIKTGFNEQLTQYRDASSNGKKWIAQLEQKERQETGIKSLKIGYNRVFGYYIEVTKANLHLLPEGKYERKQTLTNAERYITPELKEKETLILEAEEKSISLEYDLFISIREQVKDFISRLQKLANILSQIDVLQSFATVSEEYHYTKPKFSSERKLFVKEGRHPVVEKVMDSQEYVANDCLMAPERETLLITGPNMSGKSTYMRQVALTAIMAQIGCFVPAEQAELPIFDQVFTRIGAADDLVSGQSTFMVEMLEAKNAITKATEKSLILLDEIGRGTSTYDGMALAQAIIEFIHNEIGAKTLFSTHYHELTTLEETLAELRNVHVSAIEENGKVVFLHKIKEGFADKSYGIHVAELAGLPVQLINRAREILDKLEGEAKSFEETKEPSTEMKVAENDQLSFFESKSTKHAQKHNKKEETILSTLKTLDLLEMTPLDAMNQLYQLQKSLKK